jgi:hypothetical protein
MSWTNLHRVRAERRTGAVDWTEIKDILHDGNEIASATDGEELQLAAEIVGLLDSIENGEALVITRVVF